MLNFSLTEGEFTALSEKYRTNDPDNYFNYFSFCQTINAAFTTKGIDKDPSATVKPLTKDDTLAARRKYLESSPEEEQQFNSIIQEYRTAVQNRRINLKPQFQDFDITKNSHVTKM